MSRQQESTFLIFCGGLRALLLWGVFAGATGLGTAQSLSVLSSSAEFNGADQRVPDFFIGEAYARLDSRDAAVADLKTPEQILARQRFAREHLLAAIGKLPERTPLNARVAGVLHRDGYRVEKVIFESQPGFFVTSNLYVPETGTPPYPGILFPLGHERGGKANQDWQHLLVTFVRNGFVALAYDPVGQGERIQLLAPAFGDSRVLQSTTEHTVVGVQCLLLGHNFIRHRVWDGMRALDYLVSRPEVDPKRIGCTGNSGGGTMTAHLAALDDRIQVAVPSCYITSWRELLKTIGPQDAEQSTAPILADGIDHGDLILSFAPKPYLIAAAIQDFFDINGARRTYRDIKRLYGVLGAENALDMVEADDRHGYTLPRRLASYRWMSRWLKGAEENIRESPMTIELQEELDCTETGQVLTSLQSRTVFALHQEELVQVKAERPPLENLDLETLRVRVREQIGMLTRFRRPDRIPEVRRFGQIGRDSYHIEKLVFESQPGVLTPALLFLPGRVDTARIPTVYVHGNGKSVQAQPGGDIEDLVLAGSVVLALDLFGTGETEEVAPDQRRSDFFRHFGDYDNAMTGLLTGKTMIGVRIGQVLAAVDLLSDLPGVDTSRLSVVARGTGSLTALHAAVLDDRVKNLVLEGPLLSYESVIEEKLHYRVFEDTIRGVLAHYDVPELVASVAPRRVRILNAEDPREERLRLERVASAFERTLRVFENAGTRDSFQVGIRPPEARLSELCPELVLQGR